MEIRPAHDFDDVATLLGPKNPTSSVCWCLSHRSTPAPTGSWSVRTAASSCAGLCARDVAPGVLAHDEDGTVVGWAAVAPRSELPFARSTKIPHVDDLPVWSLWCVKVRPGHRGRGIARVLVSGAADYAFDQGAPAVEGYPADNQGAKVDLTMAYVGTRALFEGAGFTKVSDTDAVSGGFPRVIMRLLAEDRAAYRLSAPPDRRPPAHHPPWRNPCPRPASCPPRRPPTCCG